MISVATGDLMQAKAEALVNPVNCVGVMGKGLALQFRERFPDMFASYVRACAEGELTVGRMHVFDRGGDHTTARWIINFPTKRHWREPSRMADIEAGLSALIAVVAERRIRSVAVPALGCGLGGLKWEEVRPQIGAAFAPLADVQVLLYGPVSSVSPQRYALRSPGPHCHQQAAGGGGLAVPSRRARAA